MSNEEIRQLAQMDMIEAGWLSALPYLAAVIAMLVVLPFIASISWLLAVGLLIVALGVVMQTSLCWRCSSTKRTCCLPGHQRRCRTVWSKW